MGWLTSPSSNGTITESKKYITENLYVALGRQYHYTRTRVITTIRYVGLTQGAAETQASTSSGVTGSVDAHTEVTGGGSYAALGTTDIVTDWVLVP